MTKWWLGAPVLALVAWLGVGTPRQAAPQRDILYTTVARDSSRGEQIWRLRPDGSHPAQVTRESGVFDNMAVWSPDGRHIAFTSNRDGRQGVYLMDADGSHIRPIGPNGNLGYPEWSPDGGSILYSAGRLPKESQIYLMKADGSDVRQLTSDSALNRCPRMSPDGARVVYTSEIAGLSELKVLDLKTGQTRRVLPDGIEADCADWAPDGVRLAFASGPDRSLPAFQDRIPNWTPILEIFVLDLRTGKVTQLTHAGSVSNYPKWSRDGRRILFQSTQAFGTAVVTKIGNWFDIYTMNADGSDVRRLTQNELFDAHPSW